MEHSFTSYVYFSYITDEELNKNISIQPSHIRKTHIYTSVGHVINFHFSPANEDKMFLIHYQGNRSCAYWTTSSLIYQEVTKHCL